MTDRIMDSNGVELDGPAAALLDAGVVVNAVTPTALRLAPSLLISDDEIDLAVAAIADAIAAVAAVGAR